MTRKQVCKGKRSQKRVAMRSERRAYRQMLLRARDAVVERMGNNNVPVVRRQIARAG